MFVGTSLVFTLLKAFQEAKPVSGRLNEQFPRPFWAMHTAAALLVAGPPISRCLNLRKTDLTLNSQINTTGNHQQFACDPQQRGLSHSLLSAMNQKSFPQISERATTMTSENTWILEQGFKHVGPPLESKIRRV